MSIKRFSLHVISHTHWDREWYQPFETYRVELIDLIDNLLKILKKDTKFIFHLDGYSLLIEDYLKIKPENEQIIKKHIRSGNLLAGPWYVLSDQFLTSGESTIRNLLYGISYAKNLGKVMHVGYLPDQFGQIAQLPQILKGFKINSAILARGIQDKKAEHSWIGLNGDSILAIALTNWYNNAQTIPLNKNELIKYLNKIYQNQSKSSLSGHLILMNGCDHIFPQNNLKKILTNNTNNKHWTLKQDNLPDTVKSILKDIDFNKIPIRYGELRDDNNMFILASTLSSRVYLKLANYACQTNLEKIIEPLATLFSLKNKLSYPYEQIKYAWKLLIENHAHDSICGCSIDEVHREMEVRFEKVNQVFNKLKNNLLLSLEEQDIEKDKKYLQTINLTSYKRDDVIEVELEFPLSTKAKHPDALPIINKKEIKSLNIKDKNGKNVDFQILENYKTLKPVYSRYDVPRLLSIQRIKILSKVSLEPYSITSYRITTSNTKKKSVKNQKKSSKFEFENKDYILNINKDGTLNILLKENNYKFKNLHSYTIENDYGDLYRFIPNKKDKIIKKVLSCEIKVIEENNLRKQFLFKIKTLSQDIETKITCFSHTTRMDFKSKINNMGKDQRLRLHFPTLLNSHSITSDTPFGTLQRIRPSKKWTNYAKVQPLHNWIEHSNNKAGLGFFGGGISEYELYKNGNGFATTLIRSIGKLSIVKSHSLFKTPEGQCNREIEISYSIYPHTGDCNIAKTSKEQLLSQVPIIKNQTSKNYNIDSLITIEDNVIVSSIKKSEKDKNIYIIRLFNPENKNIKGCKLILNFLFKKVRILNLNEEIIRTASVSKRSINLGIKPYEIITIGVEI